MRIETAKPGGFHLTLHAYELSALIAAARWTADGAEGELSREAREQLRQVLKAYDTEVRRLESG